MSKTNQIEAMLEGIELSPARVKEFAAAIARTKIPPKSVFPKGTPRAFGGEAVYHVSEAELPGLLADLTRGGGMIPDLSIFPIGIVAPEGFDVRVNFGNTRF